eukprot:12175279-Alexandrium_andersonii.AAC.1
MQSASSSSWPCRLVDPPNAFRCTCRWAIHLRFCPSICPGCHAATSRCRTGGAGAATAARSPTVGWWI